jgi:hypothetical protein
MQLDLPDQTSIGGAPADIRLPAFDFYDNTSPRQRLKISPKLMRMLISFGHSEYKA